MIMCPKCQHMEVEGTIFCDECGTQLVYMDTLVTQTIQTSGIGGNALEVAQQKRPNTAQIAGVLTLQLLDSGEFLSSADRNEFTLGRISDGQPIMPDIDLTKYRAYECGVSRLHAILRKNDKGLTLMDLGSSNGTFLNGTRLKPDQDYPLKNGSVVSLGKLKIQVLFKK